MIYNLKYYLERIQEKGLIRFIALIFLNFGYYSHIYIIIDIFSPFHIFLIIMIYYAISGLVNFIPSIYEQFFVLDTIFLIIMLGCLFFVLVFIEIIELNCFRLSYMTKKNIELRARIDTYISNIAIDNDDENSNKDISYEGYTITLNNKKPFELNNIYDNNSLNEDWIINKCQNNKYQFLIIFNYMFY